MARPQGWRPRLVALDIDGTICAEDGDPLLAHTMISPGVRTAVAAVAHSGTHVVLCTGRPVRSVRPFLSELGLSSGVAICSNGAIRLDAATGEILDRIVFDPAEPVALFRRLLPGAVFTAEDDGVGDRTTRLAVHWPGRTGADLAAALSVASMPWIECSISLDTPWLVATAAGVTKASALEKLRVELGVAQGETLAVGDGVNDLHMLAWAAHGVAMGQAPDVVRAAADEVCLPVVEDGLATLLARWF
ncbi:HAD family hydrolase [Nocardia sp. NPDC058058]|uniref:HAD family hydrolase n=1 Tax=Nocardia sp. NPDC058058 TaxID=3346317 RepID=UPI0036D82DE3